MTARPHRPVRGERPWPSARSAEVPYESPAERQFVPYRCRRGHDFEVTFAAGVLAPAEWDCRCGARAVLADDRPAGPPTRSSRKTARIDDDPGHCMVMLLKRRTRTELETALNERIAELHQGPARPDR